MDLGLETLPSFTPTDRPRRLRRTPALRALVRETRLDPSMLIAPLFVRPGRGIREPVPSMPGVMRLSVDAAVGEAERLASLGVGGVLLFGLPAWKDADGSGAWSDDGIVQETFEALRERDLPLVLVADTCLCEYTAHGHCGPLRPDGAIDNDEALVRLARTAVSQARAGADIVAPSAMMDGQVAAIRTALDAADLLDTAIMAYAAKSASSFYGPFREAADSAPSTGDRRGYQMDPANGREALREMTLDVAEGADILLVKPGLPCLDLVAAARASFDLPVAVYQVSGEFAMIAAAAERGWIDGRRVMTEAVTSMARAGGDIVITYAAADIAGWIAEERGERHQMSDDTIYVQAVALGLDPAWRRLPTETQEADVAAVLEAETETTQLGIRTLTYSTVGLEPGVDMLLFRLAPSVEALESAGSRLARSGLGRWLSVRHSLLGLIGPSQYIRKPTSQERSVLDGEPAAYLVVYPFTKSTDWYLQSREERQSIMNEHMRVGHRYPTVRQLLAYSFGLDDQDFVVAYDTDDLAAFGSLVRDLRGTESRRSTVRDTPLLLGVHRPLPELLGRLVGRTAVVA